MNRIYIVKIACTDFGKLAFDYIENYQIYTEIFTDYIAATKRLLVSAAWENIDNMVWLEVYDENKDNNCMQKVGTYHYNVYGKNEIGTKFYREENASQFKEDEIVYFGCDAFEIYHYIPEGYEKLYKKAKMELKLAK